MKRFICSLLAALLVLSGFSVCAIGTSATAAALINGDTGEVIYANNADARLSMASTTKIMTALLLCENGDFEKEITVTAEMLRVEGSSMGLLPGDRVTHRDLLYGMLLASGNDAAQVTAISLGGTVTDFADMMNEKAAEIGLVNTHFVTPSGLDAEGHYTTAKELALLARYAMKNEEFAAAAASDSAVLNYGNPPYRRTLKNHNRLLKSFEGAVGVKTGFTKKSGRCLVSAARRDGKFVIAVTLNDPNDWQDHTALLEYGLETVKQTSYMPKTSSYMIPVIGADTDAIEVEIKPFTVNTLETADITCTVRLPKFIYAPISSGEILGSAEYEMNGEILGTAQLTASKDIAAVLPEKEFLTQLKENIKYILRSI